ncbi:MAG: 4'-phosphopantetheinyl transferase superfamily protein [Clostridia bacterium]|nr:4'-phosphopantetheinyl transferase superfamily protein [Clostridia bacterium]
MLEIKVLQAGKDWQEPLAQFMEELGLFMPEIVISQSGKPDFAKTYHFSVSHSGGYLALMVSDKPCGIDIELAKHRNWEALAKRFIKETSISSEAEFYRAWVSKEAYGKMTGRGVLFSVSGRAEVVKSYEDKGLYMAFATGEEDD